MAGDERDVAAPADTGAGYDVGRLLAFSDGVFAIAITLLVLTIPVPHVPDPAQLPGRLRALTPSLLGFALSFWLVGTQWIAHHRLLRPLRFTDTRLLGLNLLLLMGICLVPFGSALLTSYGGSAAGTVPYAGLQASIGIVFMAMRLYLLRRGVDVRKTLVLSWLPVVTFLLSIPAALRDVNLAYALWLAGFGVSRLWATGRFRWAWQRIRSR